MSGTSFKAKLVMDVAFKDFAGRWLKQKAGTIVDVFRRHNSDYVCTDAVGNPVQKPEGAFIAVNGKIHFTVQSYEFQAFN